MSEPTLDLTAYFARIEHHGPRDASLATLRALHARHPSHVPFENLDVLLGRPIRLDAVSVEQKLVHARRGGYCFEQNGHFARVLRALGFEVKTLAARVRWNLPPEMSTPRSHMVLEVSVAGRPYLVDVGFGGLTLTAPLAFDTDREQTTPHETYRIVDEGSARRLQVSLGGAWKDVYLVSLEPQEPVDYEVTNWFTSTNPTSRFVQNLIVARPDDGVRYVLLNRELTVRRGEATERRNIETGDELLRVLDEIFGLRFPEGTRFGPRPDAPWPT